MPHALDIARPGSFADAVRTKLDLSTPLYDVMLVVLGALVVAMTAQIAIPMPSGVPITGQTFGVLLVSAALGFKRGFAAMLAYVAMGVIGLPFFASAGGAMTYGYIAGFVVAGAVVGLMADLGWDRTMLRSLVMMTIGTAIIFACGAVWGAQYVSSASILYGNFVGPYLPGAAIKIALAMTLLPAAWKLTNKNG